MPLEIQLSRRKVWHPINRFNPAHIVPVPRQNLDFQRWYVVVSPLFYGDCSLYWYRWYCWPSLFKLSFHKGLVNSSMCATTHPKGKHTGPMGPKKNLTFKTEVNKCLFVRIQAPYTVKQILTWYSLEQEWSLVDNGGQNLSDPIHYFPFPKWQLIGLFHRHLVPTQFISCKLVLVKNIEEILQINLKETNQEWTIQRNWQHCLHKTHVLDTSMHKPTQITFVKLTLNNKRTINNFVIINTSLDKRSTYSTHFWKGIRKGNTKQQLR